MRERSRRSALSDFQLGLKRLVKRKKIPKRKIRKKSVMELFKTDKSEARR